MVNDQIKELKAGFEKTFESLKKDLARVRTGRANANLLDGVRVNYYGQPTPVSQVASVQVPEARLITLKPWEPGLLKEIERAILQSDLGLTPSNDGQIICLSIPPLTEDRRKDLVKQVKRHGEDAKVALRNHRRDVNAAVKKITDDGKISEDEGERGLKKIQDETDAAVKKVDELLAAKEKELMEV
jgi:ribosome recycling factor